MDTKRQREDIRNNKDLINAWESGNNDEAIRILIQIVNHDESHEDALFLLSQCYLNKNEYFPALRCLKRCRELKTKNISVYISLCDLYRKLFVLELARHYLQPLVETKEIFDDVLVIKYIDVLNTMNRNDEAIEFLEMKCAENQDSDKLAFMLALNFLIVDTKESPQVDKATAIADKLTRKGFPQADKLKKLIESHNTEADLLEENNRNDKANEHLSLAEQHAANQDFNSAMEELWAALDWNPRLAIAYTHLGAIYDNLGFLEEGFSLHEYAIRLDPNLAIAHNNLGYVLNLIGNTDEAIKAYERALELDPNLVVALNSLGTTYDNLGDFEKGISLFQKSLEIEPNKPTTLTNMAFALRSLGRFAEAREYFEHAIRVDPKWIIPRINLADLYLALDCPSEAETQLLEVIKIEPNVLIAWIKLTHCYGIMSDTRRFLEALERVNSIPPSNPDDIFDLAELFSRVDKNRALELWKYFLQEGRRIRLHPSRIEHAKKRIEQIEGTIM